MVCETRVSGVYCNIRTLISNTYYECFAYAYIYDFVLVCVGYIYILFCDCFVLRDKEI